MLCIKRISTLCACLTIANAQIADFRKTKQQSPGKGIGCNSFSIYAGLNTFGRSNDPQLVPLKGADFSGGAAAECDFKWRSERTDVSLEYNVSYTANYSHPDLNGRTNMVAFSIGRKLTPRFNWTLGVDGGDVDATTGLFAPSDALKLVQTSLGFGAGSPGQQLDDFSSVAPQRGFVGTDRLVVRGIQQQYASVDTSLLFEKSSRTTWYANLRSDYSWTPFPDPNDPRSSRVSNFGYAAAGFGVQYLVSSRTQISADFGTQRGLSSSGAQIVSGGTLTVNRLLSPHWSAQIQGGIGTFHPVGRNSGSGSVDSEFIGLGGLAYKGYASRFFLFVSRQMGGGFTAAYPSTIASGAAWTWEKPGEPYTIGVAADWQHSTRVGARPLTLGLFAAGVGRRLNPTTSVFVQAVRASDRGLSALGTAGGEFLNTGPAGLARAAVRISLVFTPHRHRTI